MATAASQKAGFPSVLQSQKTWLPFFLRKKIFLNTHICPDTSESTIPAIWESAFHWACDSITLSSARANWDTPMGALRSLQVTHARSVSGPLYGQLISQLWRPTLSSHHLSGLRENIQSSGCYSPGISFNQEIAWQKDRSLQKKEVRVLRSFPHLGGIHPY